MRLAVIAVLPFLLQGPTAPDSLKNKASIEGVILRAGTQQPVADARVTLAGAFPSGLGPDAMTQTLEAVNKLPTLSISTDTDGRFSFKGVEPGSYNLAVTADGYVRRNANRQGAQILVGAGESLKDMTVSLVATGSVTGRIRDQYGRAAVGVPVVLLKPVYNVSGERVFQTAGTVRTDDRGEYRLYWITPGRYFLVAGNEPGPRQAGSTPLPPTPNEDSDTTFSVAYYPGIPDVSHAAMVEVISGSSLEAIDWSCTKYTSLRRVRGRVVDGANRPPPNVQVSLLYRRATGAPTVITSVQSYDAATGSFELRNVVPGRYAIQAQFTPQAAPSRGDAPASTDSSSSPSRMIGSAEITVEATDLEGVIVRLSELLWIAGRFVVEQGGTDTVYRSNLIVSLRSATAEPLYPLPQLGREGNLFHLDGVQSGNYRLRVTANGAYVKSARLQGVDVLNTPFQIVESVVEPMEVVVRTDVSKVSGTVLNDKSQPVQGAQVVLIPDNRNRSDLYYHATVGPAGTFTFFSVAPGDYRLFAWTSIEAYSWFDPQVIAPLEVQGIRVHLEGGDAQENIAVQAIPSAAQ